MSDTPAPEPQTPPEAPQPSPSLPGDPGPQDASTRAEAAVEGAGSARPPAAGAPPPLDDALREPPMLLHDHPAEAAQPAQSLQPDLVADEPYATSDDTDYSGYSAPPVLVTAGGGRGLPVAPQLRLVIDHVPSVGHCYPGEMVLLYTRVRAVEEVPGLTLAIQLPHWLRVGSVSAPPVAGIFALEVGTAFDLLRWEVRQPLQPGAVLEFETPVTVPVVDHLVRALSAVDEFDRQIVSSAQAAPLPVSADATGAAPASATAVVLVRHKGAYLKHLPAVYERDSFMSRFLMLFESFWAPIDAQINTISNYFDPYLTPLPMLHWLAERLDLALDDDLPEATARRLVAQAVPLYRRRGTRAGMEQLLEIYTGGAAEIIERRANNLRLSRDARLGHGVALGVANQPHTFTVRLRLPPIPDDPAAPGAAERQRSRRRERVRRWIELEKPAHVTYTLDIDEDEPL